MQSGQQYLRARFYDPASGTFNRLDPYAGNLADPQSLHKYLYSHANPVAFSDPSGYFAEPLLLGGQSGGTTSWVRVITSGLIGAAFAHGDAFLRTMYLTGDIDAANEAARAAAAAGFAMGMAVGMLEGRFTPYIGLAAFATGISQAKQALQAGYYELAALDFTLAIFSFFTGVYRPLAAQARGAGRLPVANGNASANNTGGWISRPEGTRIKKVGNYWIKEVDPNASAIRQWWGRGSLKAQAKALDKLGDLATPHTFKNGKLVMRDAGQFSGSAQDFLSIRIQGSWSLGTPFNDIWPRNIGANGQIFDPALHPIHQAAWWTLGGVSVVGGGALAYYEWQANE